MISNGRFAAIPAIVFSLVYNGIEDPRRFADYTSPPAGRSAIDYIFTLTDSR